jgi:hypothetical protein
MVENGQLHVDCFLAIQLLDEGTCCRERTVVKSLNIGNA